MASAVERGDERGEVGIGREQAVDGGQAGQGLALVDGAGRVLDQVGQRGAQVAELIGEVGVAELVAAAAAPAIAAAPGTATLTGIADDLGQRRAVGPNVAVTVASSVVFSGVEASGVRVIVSVVDCPPPATPGPARSSVKPEGSVSVRAMLLSATLPTFVIVSVSVTGLPGIVFTVVGPAVTVTASIVGDGECFGLRLGDRRIGRAGRRDGRTRAGFPAPGSAGRCWAQVDAEDSRFSGRDVTLVPLSTIVKPLGTFENVRL